MKSVSWLKFLPPFASRQKSLRAKFVTVIVLVQLLLIKPFLQEEVQQVLYQAVVERES